MATRFSADFGFHSFRKLDIRTSDIDEPQQNVVRLGEANQILVSNILRVAALKAFNTEKCAYFSLKLKVAHKYLVR